MFWIIIVEGSGKRFKASEERILINFKISYVWESIEAIEGSCI